MEPAEYLKMDAAEDGMWWYRALHARLMDAVASVDGAVLDAGCGTGGLLAAMGPVRPQLRLFGVEWAAEAATRAARKSARAGAGECQWVAVCRCVVSGGDLGGCVVPCSG